VSSNGQAKQRRFRGLVGAGLTLLITWIFLAPPFWPGLRNLSYDLPFRFRPNISVEHDGVIIVYMDDESHRELRQPSVQAWKRSLHAQLVNRLTAAQARVIAFDVFFENADTNNPAADAELLQAAQAHGKVLFAAVTGPEKHPNGEKIGQHVQRPFGGLDGAAETGGENGDGFLRRWRILTHSPSPSPGTPGEGRGEGFARLISLDQSTLRKEPSP
jgi:CHASE2 domain-containing sensor protein